MTKCRKCECSIFLGGDHTRVKTVVMSKVGGLAAFTKKRVTCVGCRAAIDGINHNITSIHSENSQNLPTKAYHAS